MAIFQLYVLKHDNALNLTWYHNYEVASTLHHSTKQCLNHAWIWKKKKKTLVYIMSNHVVLTVLYLTVSHCLDVTYIYFLHPSLSVFGQDDKQGRRRLGIEKWSTAGMGVGSWESYGYVKQLAQRFLTALLCILMPPSQRPRNEVRRSSETSMRVCQKAPGGWKIQ